MSNKKIPRSLVERGIFCSLFPVCVLFSPVFRRFPFPLPFLSLSPHPLPLLSSPFLFNSRHICRVSLFRVSIPLSSLSPIPLPLCGVSVWGYSLVRHFPFCIRHAWRIGNAALSPLPCGEGRGGVIPSALDVLCAPPPLARFLFVYFVGIVCRHLLSVHSAVMYPALLSWSFQGNIIDRPSLCLLRRN